MSVVRAGCERLHRRHRGVAIKDAGQGVQERALTVRPSAVPKRHRVLTSDAGETVARETLQEGFELRVGSCNPGREPMPERTIATGRDSRHLSHVVVGSVGSLLSSTQIYDAPWRIQQPR